MDLEFYIAEDDPPGKKAILRNGLRLFAERGFSATSIRDIAAATGLSNPALYKHFKTKEALALVLFERSYRELRSQLRIATRKEPDFPEKFRAFITAFAGFYDEHPHALVFMTDNLAALWPQASESLGDHTIITDLRKLLNSGRSDGWVTSEDNIELQITLVIGTLAQLTRQLFLRALKGPAAQYLNQIERILRAGLA